MCKLFMSAVVGSAFACVASMSFAQVEAMDDPAWGYVITGLGNSGKATAYVFTNTTETMSWTAPAHADNVELLVVGGGGAGGDGTHAEWGLGGGGGGGAGGYLHLDGQSFTKGDEFLITVGAGAASCSEGRGGSSKFGDIEVMGGGCGGMNNAVGCDGASGGGGSSGKSTTEGFKGGSDIDANSDGNAGGAGAAYFNSKGVIKYYTGGGGGGAGGAGDNAQSADFGGNGGTGVECWITGERIVYASGGGGATSKDSNTGVIIGGKGGEGAGNGGVNENSLASDAMGYGCGGGGGCQVYPDKEELGDLSDKKDLGGKGFQGVVIVRVNPLPNNWTTEPSVSATEWIVGLAPDDITVNLGEAEHGTVECNWTADALKDQPIGDYEVVFSAAEEGYETAQKTVVVKVIAEAVEITLTDEDGNPVEAEDLSAGSTVVVNFTDNDNQDLVLSVAYGRYDKEYNFTTDPDTLEKADKEGREYNPEQYGGWDYFDPIAPIEAGQMSYTYTIPVNFGKIYEKDWTGKDIPEKYQLPTDKIRFFLTPKDQTPMKSLQWISGTDAEKQVIDTGYVPTSATVATVTGVLPTSASKGKILLETDTNGPNDPYLVLNLYVNGSGNAAFNMRNSSVTSGKGYNTEIKATGLTKRYDWRLDMPNKRARARVPGDDSWSNVSAASAPTAPANGTFLVRGVASFGSVTMNESSGWQRYMMASLGYNSKGELVPGLYCSILHKFFSSEGGMEFVAGPDDDTYNKDLLKGVPVRGMSDLMSCHVHEWDYENVEVLVPATCTKKGNGQVACKVDGCPFPDARLAVEIDALGHAWGDWVVEKQPTCTEAGYRVRTCTREECDHIGSPETNALAKVAHQRIFVKEEGGKLHYACANCETAIVEDPAYGQTWDWLQTDGTGYIVTDYKPSFLATKIVSNVAKWSKATTSSLYSDDITGMSGKFQLRLWTSGTISFYNWPYGDNHGQPWSEAKFENAQTGIPFQHIAYQDRATFRGVTSASGANEYWADFTDATRRAEKPLVFFADLNAGKADKIATAKVRGFKVYEVVDTVETLVHDYVPATKSGANAGLWDRVENKYWSANSAGFTTGKNQGLAITIR